MKPAPKLISDLSVEHLVELCQVCNGTGKSRDTTNPIVTAGGGMGPEATYLARGCEACHGKGKVLSQLGWKIAGYLGQAKALVDGTYPGFNFDQSGPSRSV